MTDIAQLEKELLAAVASAKDEAAKCATSLRFYADRAAAFLANEPVAVDGEKIVRAPRGFPPLRYDQLAAQQPVK